jgi:hypothetical protein
MTGNIHHPEHKHPQPYQDDLSPDASKGINYGNVADPKTDRSAYDLKDMRNRFPGFSEDELKQIPLLAAGSRLETGAKYLSLSNPRGGEYQAKGDETVYDGDEFVAKKDVPYELWNRLLGISNPARTKMRED